MDNFQALKGFYSWIDQRQWTSQHKNEKFTLINNFTGDQFTYQKISIFSQHIYQVYKARGAYSLSHTPKIILPDLQENPNYINLLVQRGKPNFHHYLEQCGESTQVLQIFKHLLTIIMVLCKRYGLFRIKKNMIKMTKLGFFQVWINSSEQSCHREFPLNSGNLLMDCRTMIGDLLSIFMESKHQQSFTFLSSKVNEQKVFTFENAKYLIQLALKKQKITPKKSSIQSPLSPKSQLPDFLRKRSQNFKEISHFNTNSISNPSSLSDQKSDISAPESFLKKKKNSLKHLSSCKFFQKKDQFNKLNMENNLKSSERKRGRNNLFSESKNIKMSLSTPQSPKTQINEGTNGFMHQKLNHKNFRDSGNSLATTNFYQSTFSSLKNEDSLNFGDKKLLTSFGNKKLDENLKDNPSNERPSVKYSKIIEEGEDAPNSLHSQNKSEPQEEAEYQSQIEKDFQFLLSSQQIMEEQKKVQDLKALQNQINNILWG